MEVPNGHCRWPAWSFPQLQTSLDQWLKACLLPALSARQIPRHLAFIMDGNRRFAQRNGIRKIDAHSMGFSALKRTLEWCLEIGVEVVTVYAFSIENFQRPKEEVDDLMELAKEKFTELLDHSDLIKQYSVSIRVLGDLSLLRPDVQAVLSRCFWETRHNKKSALNICFSYTSQHEMTQAVKEIAMAVSDGTLLPCDVSEDLVDQSLYTGEDPPVDVVLRTSGEVRLSDFLLWQSSFSLLDFMHVLWPEFGLWQFVTAVLNYRRQLGYMERRRAEQKAKRRAERQSVWCQMAHRSLMERKGPKDEDAVAAEMCRLERESDERCRAFLAGLRRDRLAYVHCLLSHTQQQRGP